MGEWHVNMQRGWKAHGLFGEQKSNHLIGSSLGFTQRGSRSPHWKELVSVLMETPNNWVRRSELSRGYRRSLSRNGMNRHG